MTDITNLYSEKVLDHFNHPRNVGEMENPDGVGTVGNPVCGDVMRLFIKIKEKDGEEYIEDAKFQTLGCGAAIATSSIATEMIKGKPLKDAVKLTNQAITEALGGLPKAKVHCSVLAADAVKKAVEDYESRK
jgi:nitrogen fixation NifU-like protein